MEQNQKILLVAKKQKKKRRKAIFCITTHSVTYDGNSNTTGTAPVDTNAYKFLSKVTVPGNTGVLVKTGYDFAGWNTNADGTGANYPVGAIVRIGSYNLALYAQWSLV